MRSFHVTLGGEPVEIVAPEVGTWDGETADRFRAAFPCPGVYGLDVETTYMDDLAQWSPDFGVRLIQFSTETVAWVLNLADDAQYEAARTLLSTPLVAFCSHYNIDVLTVALRLGVDITMKNVDTLSLATMAHPDENTARDLKTLTTRYIGPELEQAETALHAVFDTLWDGRKNAKRSVIDAHGWAKVDADEPAYLVYAGMDAMACRRLVEPLIKASGNPAHLVEMEVWLAGQANRIQLRGMRVDPVMMEELEGEAIRETTEANEVIVGTTGGISARSPKLHDWLGEHGVDWDQWNGALTTTGKPSLAKDNVKLLLDYDLDEDGRRVADQLIRFKAHLDALNKTKGVRDHLTADWFVHPVLKPMGATTTARMSSTGPNFQNFSKKDPRMRGLFVPEPGHILATIDFDQVELRVVAALAREAKMIETILAGGDLHQLTVEELASAGVEIDRDTAKMTNFLIVYGGGGSALSAQAGIPLEAAQEIVATFRSRYEAIDDLSRALARLDEVRTVSNRRLPITYTKNGDPRRYANINYVVQSSARELLVDAWHRFAIEFGHGRAVWFPVHDELVLQVPEDDADRILADAETCMRFDFMGVPISATAIKLLEADGTSRWMTSKRAEKIAKGVVA